MSCRRDSTHGLPSAHSWDEPGRPAYLQVEEHWAAAVAASYPESFPESMLREQPVTCDWLAMSASGRWPDRGVPRDCCRAVSLSAILFRRHLKLRSAAPAIRPGTNSSLSTIPMRHGL